MDGIGRDIIHLWSRGNLAVKELRLWTTQSRRYFHKPGKRGNDGLMAVQQVLSSFGMASEYRISYH